MWWIGASLSRAALCLLEHKGNSKLSEQFLYFSFLFLLINKATSYRKPLYSSTGTALHFISHHFCTCRKSEYVSERSRGWKELMNYKEIALAVHTAQMDETTTLSFQQYGPWGRLSLLKNTEKYRSAPTLMWTSSASVIIVFSIEQVQHTHHIIYIVNIVFSSSLKEESSWALMNTVPVSYTCEDWNFRTTTDGTVRFLSTSRQKITRGLGHPVGMGALLCRASVGVSQGFLVASRKAVLLQVPLCKI